MDGPEVADVTHPIELLSNDSEARGLLEIKSRLRYQITRGEEIRHPGTDVVVRFRKYLLDVPFYDGRVR